MNYEPRSPEWWLHRLHDRMLRRADHVNRLWAYYDGDHPLGFASSKFLEAFGGMFRAFASNWCPVVIDAKHQRLHVVGFRVGSAAEGDDRATRIWQENALDAESQLAHIEALVSGEGYALVWPNPGDVPEIVVESSRSCIVETDPRNRRRRLAGLRLTKDVDDHLVAEVFLPGETFTFRSSRAMSTATLTSAHGADWRPWDDVSGAELEQPVPIPSGIEVVPLVPFSNRPRLIRAAQDTAAQSELVSVIPVQDAVNKLMADMIVAAEFAAMPQRYATGLDDSEDLQINEWKQRLWTAEGEGVQFGQFAVADLGNYIKGVETLVQHIATQSATPPHYFFLKGQFPSGESIKSAEASLIAAVRDRMNTFGEAWEEVMRIALVLDGVTEVGPIETIWKNPETRTEGELADAVLKRTQAGVPQQQAWEDLGYTPDQIGRFQQMRGQDLILQNVGPADFVSDDDAS